MKKIFRGATLIGAFGFAIAALSRYYLGSVFAAQPVPTGEVNRAIQLFQTASQYLGISLLLLLAFIGVGFIKSTTSEIPNR